jgi:predicted negative regulator of RcsB-dependent stress response
MSSRLFRPVHFGTLASAHARLGQVDTALDLMDRAFTVADRTGERRANSALNRLRGEILLGAGRRAEAMAAFTLARAIAEAQNAVAEAERAARALTKLGAGGPHAAGSRMH